VVTVRRVLIDLWSIDSESEEQYIPQEIAQRAVEVSGSGAFLERDVIVNGMYSRRRGRVTRTTLRGDYGGPNESMSTRSSRALIVLLDTGIQYVR